MSLQKTRMKQILDKHPQVLADSIAVVKVPHDQQRKQFIDATRQIRIGGCISHHSFKTTRYTIMEYAQQLANIANVQNYAAGLKNTRLASLKHPGEFFDWQRVGSILQFLIRS